MYKANFISIVIMHDKTNEITCVPSCDSNIYGHIPSLIRVFTVSIKEVLGPDYNTIIMYTDYCDQPRQISELGMFVIILVVLYWDSFTFYKFMFAYDTVIYYMTQSSIRRFTA